MSILKLKPACKDYLWGGHRLVDEYNVEYEGDILAEAWELSCHPDGPSMIMNGPYEGKSLRDYLEAEGMEVLGTHCRRFREFPILTKFIDAKDNLEGQPVDPGPPEQRIRASERRPVWQNRDVVRSRRRGRRVPVLRLQTGDHKGRIR